MAATKNEEIDALVAAGDAVRLTTLAGSPDKDVAKAARRGLHVLRTRGVSAPEVKKVATTPRPIVDTAEAWTCVPDANGERLVVAIVPAPGGDFFAITAHVSDERGILQIAFGKGPRKHAREVRHSFEQSGGFAADVGIERAAELIDLAYQTTLARGASPPAEFAAAHRVLPRVHVTPGAPHPALAELPAPAVFNREQAELLHKLPTIARWVPSAPELRALEQRLEEVATSRLLIDGPQRQAAWQDVIDKAIVTAFDGAGRVRWRRRALDAALVFAAAGLRDDAANLRAQADLLVADGFDPLTDPFARALVEKITRGLRIPPPPAAEPEAAPASGSLIIPP